MMAPLLSCIFAAAAVAADPAGRSVTFTATATGVTAGTPLEFVFVGPDSDRAYEAGFVTDARVKDLAAAFDKAGIPRGGPVDARSCRFWPTGAKVRIEPDIWSYVSDGRGEAHLPVVYTGGARSGGLPAAETEMPSSVLALYNCGQSLMLLDDTLDQSAAYGRFLAAKALEKGARVSFKVSWDGSSGTVPHRLEFRPGRVKEALEAMKAAMREGGLDVTADFAPDLALREAILAANSLAVLDSRAVRVNGAPEGQFYYRAFLPLEKWRDRKERLVQPLEARLSGSEEKFTVVDEDWTVEGVDPNLTPRDVDFAGACAVKSDTCLVFAPPDTPLSRLYNLKKRLPSSLRNWYLYAD